MHVVQFVDTFYLLVHCRMHHFIIAGCAMTALRALLDVWEGSLASHRVTVVDMAKMHLHAHGVAATLLG